MKFRKIPGIAWFRYIGQITVIMDVACMVYPWKAVGIGYDAQPLRNPNVLELGHADLF